MKQWEFKVAICGRGEWFFINADNEQQIHDAFSNSILTISRITKGAEYNGQFEPIREQFANYELYLTEQPPEGMHLCQYCGEVAEGTYEDLLCKDCRETFGHSLYSELRRNL